MTDHSFTPALLLFGIVLGSFLSYLELLWLKRPFHFDGSWFGLVLVAVLNILFIYLIVGLANSYGTLLIFPVPLIPAVYVLSKAAAYFAIQRVGHSPVHAPWKLALLSLVFHSMVFGISYGGFSSINPTQSNLLQAIREKRNRLLEVMLWISVKSEPNMKILVNDAIQSQNDAAVEKLIRHGADPRQDYWLRLATEETRWQIAKWMIDRGVTRDEFDNLSQSPGLSEIVLGQGTADLEYCLHKGYTFESPGVVNLALTEQSLRQAGTIQPDEMQAIKDKIRILVDHGADINSRDAVGVNPIFTLFTMGLDMPEVLTYLIAKGADVNRRSETELYPPDFRELPRGLTPLMVAAVIKPQYLAILLESGADKAARDAQGHTALDYAKERKADESILRLLQ